MMKHIHTNMVIRNIQKREREGKNELKPIENCRVHYYIHLKCVSGIFVANGKYEL